jgi:hypothetical protein
MMEEDWFVWGDDPDPIAEGLSKDRAIEVLEAQKAKGRKDVYAENILTAEVID